MTEIEALVEEWRWSCAGDAWHGPSLEDLLRSLGAEAAAAHPVLGAHSVWVITLHLTGWTVEVARRLGGGVPGIPEGGDWPAVGEVKAEGWAATRAALARAQEGLERALASFPSERLSERVGSARDAPLGSGVSHRAMVSGLFQHNAYHGGQIALLRRALGLA